MENKEMTYYSPKQIATKYDIHYVTVLRWIKKGTLKSVKVGKQNRISEKDLESFMEGNK